MYPNRKQPNHKLIKRMSDHLGENVLIKNITREQKKLIFIHVIENPEVWTRRIEATKGINEVQLLAYSMMKISIHTTSHPCVNTAA